MSDRSERWHATRRVRELALFSGKRFEVVREVKNEEFETPLGYKGKNGYEVRNVESGETFKVGKATLKRMATEYEAVALPPAKKRGRPKKVNHNTDLRTVNPIISPNTTSNATGGLIQAPGAGDSDQIPAFLSGGHVYPASLVERYGEDAINKINQGNGNEPGAHPVSEQEPDEDDRSGSQAGPTYGNPNENIHL